MTRTPRLSLIVGLIIAASTPAWGQTGTALGSSRQLVIPFENATHEGRYYWLAEGSAVVLTDDLLALGVPAITRDDRLRAFDRLHVPAVAGLSHATVIRLGQLVGASQVVLGTFEVSGDQIVVRARTIRLDAGRMAPEVVEQGPLTELFGVYARVARRIVPSSGVSTAEMEQGHPPLPAFELYIKGVLAEAPATKITYLTEALMQAPTFNRARLSLWAVYNDEGQHQKALAAVRGVPADSRIYRRARFLGAVSQLNLGQHQEAFDTFWDLNKTVPDPVLLNNLGVVQLRRPPSASTARASSFFADATRLDDTDSDLFFNLGYAYWLEKETASAITALREAVRRNAADDEAHYLLGVALQAAGSIAEGAREKELAKRLSSTYAQWESRQPGPNAIPRGRERLKLEIDVPAALRVDNVIVASGQRDQRELATFHLDAGRRLYQVERDREAIGELRRAVYLAPYQSEAHLLLGRLYLRDGRVAEAIDELKIAIWSEDTIPAHLALAEAYMADKNDASARAEVQTVLKRDPVNADAKALLDKMPPP
jgi:tetratricopeptide (TPR) repeat protein/TolB-like protein